MSEEKTHSLARTRKTRRKMSDAVRPQAAALLSELADLQADNAALLSALEPVERHRKIGEVWVELSPHEWEDVRRLLKAEHAGAALLTELAAARAVVDAARASYDVQDYPAEKGELYAAICAYDEATKV